jgi:hypothetical protein
MSKYGKKWYVTTIIMMVFVLAGFVYVCITKIMSKEVLAALMGLF